MAHGEQERYGLSGMTSGTALGQHVTSTPPVHAPIAQVAQQLDARLSALHKLLNELETRLDPALAPNAPASGASASAAPMPGSPHAMYLSNISAGVNGACDRVERLLARLEL